MYHLVHEEHWQCKTRGVTAARRHVQCAAKALLCGNRCVPLAQTYRALFGGELTRTIKHNHCSRPTAHPQIYTSQSTTLSLTNNMIT